MQNTFTITQHPTPNTQKGNILVTALLILMVMNLLGLGLANLAAKQWGMATYKNIDSVVFGMTQSCASDVTAWIETRTATPTTIGLYPGTTITGAMVNDVYTLSGFTGQPSTSSNSDITHKLSGYSYSCNVAYITSKSATSNRTSGGEVGNSGGSYSTSGNQVTKDYYQITSTGAGPKSASKVINTIIGVEY